MALVLCTGWDQSLLDTRTLILQSAGHEVHQARTQNEVLRACKQHQFDVAVIGQSLSNRMKPVIASLVKEHCPSVRISNCTSRIWEKRSLTLTCGLRFQPRFQATFRNVSTNLRSAGKFDFLRFETVAG